MKACVSTRCSQAGAVALRDAAPYAAKPPSLINQA
jgi:hypothetical protein